MKWSNVLDIELPDNKNRIQVETLETPKLIASFLKFKILSAHADFASFIKVDVEGRAFTDGDSRKYSTLEKEPESQMKRNKSF